MPGVKGKVTDKKAGGPCEGFLIILDPGKKNSPHILTDENGKYKITGLVAGQDYEILMVPTDGVNKIIRKRFDAYADHGDATNFVTRDFEMGENV